MALYRDYRPQTFSDVLGQDTTIKIICNQIKDNSLAHAYLLTGARGTGKTSVARLIAKAANCQARPSGSSEPCNSCQSCSEISGGRSLDVVEIDAASHTSVDNVRAHIIENIHLKPARSPFKVFIIDEVHMLSTSAFNALLKTLEEPPPHVIFILATTEAHKVPETILSRCQRFNFKKLSAELLFEHLKKISAKENVEIDEEILKRIAEKAGGGGRDALSILEQILSTRNNDKEKITLENSTFDLPTSHRAEAELFVNACLDKNANQALKTLEEAAGNGAEAGFLLEKIIEIIRAKLLAEATDSQNKTKLAELIGLLDILAPRFEVIRRSPIPFLPLETAAIIWCLGIEPEKIEFTEDKKSTPSATSEIRSTPEIKPDKTPVNYPLTEHTSPQKDQKPPKNEEQNIANPENQILLKSDEVEKVWQTAKSALSALAPTLGFMLAETKARADGPDFTLIAPFAIHYDKLSEIKTKKMIEEAIKNAGFKDFNLKIIKEEKPNTGLDELAFAFGGQVV